MILGRTTAGTSTHGQLYELDAIAAVVVGGTLLVGGRGTITGTVFGVLIFATLTNVFVQNNLDSSVQAVAKGIIIVDRGAAAAALRQAHRPSDMTDAAARRGGLLQSVAMPGCGIPSEVMRTSAPRPADRLKCGEYEHRTDAGVSGVSQLFQLLRDGVPRTRAELAKSTGLARSTIAARVDELMRMGLITPIAETRVDRRPAPVAVRAQSERPPRARRRHRRLARDARRHRSHRLDPRRAQRAARRDPRPRASCSRGWSRTRSRCSSEIGRSTADLAAIGIGVPGPVEHSTGQPVNPPIMPGWDRFDVPGWVQQHLDVPVLVDNDVNIMALGERAVAWPGVEHLMFVKVATGIGAGVISGGALQRGAQGIAGDIGHVQVARGAGVPCHCGNKGCLEALASGPAIARALRAQGVPGRERQRRRRPRQARQHRRHPGRAPGRAATSARCSRPA